MAKRLFLLDGMALVYRAHFALISRPVRTSAGVNTSATFGFVNTLLSLLETENPSHVAVVFDTEEPTARHALFPEYKAQREEIPEDVAQALPVLDRLLPALGIPVIRAPGYEADDIIGTLARRAQEQGFETYMVTPDKDFAQLVDRHISMLKPNRSGSGFDRLGVEEVLAQWGVERPAQVIDILALWGDASDNIPGVPGIGEKTAKKLIGAYGSVEALLEQTGQLKGKQRENVESHRDQALLSKQLATIDCEVPLEAGPDDLLLGERDEDTLKQLFAELEFNRLGQRLFGEGFKAGRGMGAADATVETGHQAELFESTLKTIADVEHHYELIEDAAGRRRLADRLAALDWFCFDTETTSLDARAAGLVGIAFSWQAGTAAYVVFPGEREAARGPLDDFRAVFENPAIEKVGHNLKYDLKVLRWHGVTVAGALFDTMLAHALVQPDQRHGLNYLAEAYLGYSPVSITSLIGRRGREQKTMKDVAPAQAAEYAGEDADVTVQLRAVLEPALAEAGQDEVFHRTEARLVPVLADMEVEGVRLDIQALAEFSRTLGERLKRLEEEIIASAGTGFNLNSPKQLGEVLFDRLQLAERPKRTRTGQYQTSEEVLAGLTGKHEIIGKILDYREAAKLKNTYVDTLPDAVWPETGRIHTTFSQLATATGRLASANPNLQNIPIRSEQGQEIRKAFVARDADHVLLSADYSQIELRIMAALSGDQGMREAFESGRDIHVATAARVHRVPAEEVTGEMRRQAKMINYGLMYGMSTFGLAQRLGIGREEAGSIVEAYFAQFPGIRAYIDQAIAFAREHGYARTMTGRRRPLPDIRSRNATIRGAAERNAVNTPIQGSGADLIKRAMIAIFDEFQSRNLRTKMVLQIHDELLFDAPREELEDVRSIVEACMTHALDLDVPIEVEMGAGPTWLDAH